LGPPFLPVLSYFAGQLDSTGTFTGNFSTIAFSGLYFFTLFSLSFVRLCCISVFPFSSGFVRQKGAADAAMNRIATGLVCVSFPSLTFPSVPILFPCFLQGFMKDLSSFKNVEDIAKTRSSKRDNRQEQQQNDA
jgi:hypothetical protein